MQKQHGARSQAAAAQFTHASYFSPARTTFTSVGYVVCYIGVCLLAGATWTASIRTHQNVLGLFDEEGLAILAQLHVQTHRLPVDLYVHLQEDISLGDDETSCPTFRF